MAKLVQHRYKSVRLCIIARMVQCTLMCFNYNYNSICYGNSIVTAMLHYSDFWQYLSWCTQNARSVIPIAWLCIEDL